MYMWNLPKPDIQSAIDELDDIISKSRYMTVADKPVIESLYRDYDAARGDMTQARHDATPAHIQSGLGTAYSKTYEGSDLDYIRLRLTKKVYKCPMCATGLPSTLDHALPKSKYKALNVCGNNLVPMCSDCNRLKNNKTEPMLHAYYDVLPGKRRFLYADLTITDEDGLKFDFRVDDGVLSDNILQEKFKNTFSICRLSNVFRRELVTYLKDKLYKRALNSIEDIKQYLADELGREVEIYGLNHWKIAVLYGIIDCDKIKYDHLKDFL